MKEKEKQAQNALGTRKRIQFHARDWKEGELGEELIDILKNFGIFVYDDPTCEGSDTFGYLITDKKLSDEEVEKLCNEMWDDDV